MSISSQDILLEMGAKSNLTQGQLFIWLRQQLFPRKPIFNLSCVFTIAGKVDVKCFQAAFRRLISENDILRAVITDEDGVPQQNIMDDYEDFLLEYVDCSDDLESIDRWITEKRNEMFDFESRLFSSALLKIADERFAWFLNVHHIIVDLNSFPVMLSQLSECYKHVKNANDSIIQFPKFSSYVCQELEYKKSQCYLDDRHFWDGRVGGEAAAISFYGDAQVHKQVCAKRTIKEIMFDQNKLMALKELAGAQENYKGNMRVSLFNLFAAVLCIYLRYIGNRENVVFGSTYHNRLCSKAWKTVGLFSVSRPLMIEVNESDTVGVIAGKIAAEAKETIKHCSVDVGNPDRIYNVFLNFQTATFPQKFDEMPVTVKYFTQEYEEEDLHIQISDLLGNGDLKLEFIFNNDLFNSNQMDQTIGHFMSIIDAILQDHNRAVFETPVLAKNELDVLLVQYSHINDASQKTCKHHKDQFLVHQRFEQIAAQYYQKNAVVCGHKVLSYGELNVQANILANKLIALGLKAKALVPICIDRSIDLIIGILAILKAGYAYVPLDPTHPEERHSFIINDVKASIILTQSSLADRFSAHDLVVIKLEDCLASAEEIDKSNPCCSVLGDDLAYIIYTSGTTGKPNGVLIRHLSITNLMRSAEDLLHISSGDVWAFFHSVAFDFSVWEIFGALAFGGKLVIVSDVVRQSPEKFYKLLVDEKVTILNQTPGMFFQLCSYARDFPRKNNLQLRYIVFGGEKLSTRHIKPWIEVYGLITPELINMYGITETTVHTTFHRISHANILDDSCNIVGRPLPGIYVYILNKFRQPVPVGITGELYVGGAGLASGYLNRPQLSVEKFLPDPFFVNKQNIHMKNTCVGKMYKTGDVVKWLSDGNIEYIGRYDGQIKLRGYRIELDEISSTLTKYFPIKQCVTDYVHNGNKSHINVYYVLRNKCDGRIGEDAIRSFLKERLPLYMMPARLVAVHEIPLTVNGKTDFDKLRSIGLSINNNISDLPCNTDESLMLQLWQHVLRDDQIGVHDNFFELGGNSLLAMHLISLVSKHYSVKMSLYQLLEHPTVSRLSKVINSCSKSMGEACVEIAHDSQYEPFELTDMQYSYWFGRQGVLDLGSVSTHVYFEVDYRNLQIERLEAALNRLIGYQAMLRAVFLEEGKQVILKKTPYYKIKFMNIAGVCGTKKLDFLAKWRRELSHQVLNSKKGPLFEIRVVKTAVNLFRLFISLDALVFDAHSIQIFFNSWEQLYRYACLPYSLPNISFRDCVIALKKQKQGDQYLRDRAYWMKRIDNLPLGPQLSFQMSPAVIKKTKFRRCQQIIDEQDWSALQKQAEQHKLTLSSVLLSAFVIVLRRWSSNPEFLIVLPLFNRPPLHKGVDTIIGDYSSLTVSAFGGEHQYVANSSFLQNTAKLQSVLWEDLAHNLFSGVEVLRELAKQHNMVASMVAPVVFTSLLGIDFDMQTLFLTDQFVKIAYSITQTPQIWLDNKVYMQGNCLAVEWDYVSGLFPGNMIQDMHAAYCRLIKYLSSSSWTEKMPDILCDLTGNYLSSANSLSIPLPTLGLHEKFIEMASRYPTHIAIITAQEKYTYARIYKYACAVASFLDNTDVGPDSLIAVLMHKGWQQVVACLGILISGFSYLPLNTKWPKKRISTVLQQSEVQMVISQEEVLQTYANSDELEKLKTVAIEKVCLSEKSYDYRLKKLQNLNDIAYVIFTSGSTGKPKGVAVSHLSAANTINDINNRFNVGPHDRVLALSDLSFDLSVYDIFGLLSVGGTVVIPDPHHMKEPAFWFTYLIEHKVTIWNSVPMFMQMLYSAITGGLTKALDEDALTSLKVVLLSGDWIPLDLPAKVFNTFPGVEIFSLGGATEGAIWSIIYPISSVSKKWRSIPYGKALANQSIYVLNHDLQICPYNVPGEIYIGGIGVAAGYWKDKYLTDKSFLRHPETGEYLYKTGDSGLLMADGNIELIGRTDSQVKISGYRIDIREVENAIMSIDGISDAVVTVVGERFQNKRLVAHIVTESISEMISQEEKIAFRLNNFQIRKDSLSDIKTPLSVDGRSNCKYYHRKSYRQYCKKIVGVDSILNCLLLRARGQNLTSFVGVAETIDYVLKELQAYQESAQPFPKYRYPSAGGLYPVQIYLEVGRDIGQLSKGYYYFNALTHELIKIKTSTYFFADDIVLHLIGRQEAISPMYGKYAVDFCLLEAGYIISLIKMQCENINIAIEVSSRSDVIECLKLGNNDSYIVSLSMSSKPASESLLSSGNGSVTAYALAANDVNIYLYVHHNKVSGLKAGLYILEKEALKYIGDVSFLRDNSCFFDGNRDVLNDAAIVVFFAGAKTDATLRLVGEYTQNVMELLPEYMLGGCIIGYFLGRVGVEDRIRGDILSCFTIGSISKRQLDDHGYSEARRVVGGAPYDLKQAVKKWLKENLPDYMVPDIYIVSRAIPLSSNGKINRLALSRISPSDAYKKPDINSMIPRNNIEFRLQRIWSDVLKHERCAISAKFFDVGGGSLTAVDLITRIKQEFHVDRPLVWVFSNNTIAQQAQSLVSIVSGSGKYQPIIPACGVVSENVPLVLIHPGFAGAEVYIECMSIIGESRPVYLIDSYNLNSGNPMIDSIPDLAAYYVKMLQGVVPSKAYYLGGFCLGGVIAFEIAQQLAQENIRIPNLFLLNSLQSKDRLNQMGKRLPYTFADLQKSLPQRIIDYAQSLSPAQLRHWVQSANMDVKLLANYSAKVYSGSTTLLKAQKECPDDKYNGWKPLVKKLDVMNINTDHFGIMGQESFVYMAKILDNSSG
ncbi:MAG: amino acid adenylation domain-containing protein [Gammaproteobacteria bacterium]|nr:amino acid adenylation domain-containing protein [Gammaproteobacteria bacterium]